MSILYKSIIKNKIRILRFQLFEWLLTNQLFSFANDYRYIIFVDAINKEKEIVHILFCR